MCVDYPGNEDEETLTEEEDGTSWYDDDEGTYTYDSDGDLSYESFDGTLSYSATSYQYVQITYTANNETVILDSEGRSEYDGPTEILITDKSTGFSSEEHWDDKGNDWGSDSYGNSYYYPV